MQQRPRFKTGIARHALESKYPSDWRGLIVAYAPSLGQVDTDKVRGFPARAAPNLAFQGTQGSAGWVNTSRGRGLEFVGGTTGLRLEVGSSPLSLREKFQVQRLTISCWVRKTAQSTDFVEVMGASNGSSLSRGYRINMFSGGQFIFSINDFFTGPSASIASSADDGAWHHIAATYDGANMRIYYDGVEGTPDATGVSINYSTSPQFAFGGASGMEGFEGPIDNVRLYNYAMSKNEIIAKLFRGDMRMFELAPVDAFAVDSGPTALTEVINETLEMSETVIAVLNAGAGPISNTDVALGSTNATVALPSTNIDVDLTSLSAEVAI